MSQRTLTERVTMVKRGMLLVGIDLGRDDNVAVVLTDTAQRLARFKFPHTRAGYDFFYRQLEQLRAQHPGQGLLIGMEPTNHYWKWLAADLEAHQPPLPYRLVNAYTVRKHREGEQLERAKDDLRDAFQIAELLRTGKFTETQLLQGAYAQLRQYATLHMRLQHDAAQLQNVLTTAVDLGFPELRQVFKDLSGETALALLRTASCASTIRELPLSEFLAQVREQLQGHRLSVSKLKQAHALAQTSVGLVDTGALHFTIQVYSEQLAHAHESLKRTETALVELFLTLPEAPYLLSLPAISPLFAALLLAELGDPRDFSCASQWVKLAGVQPVADSSGHRTRSPTPMSHKGRSRLRELLYWLVLRWVQHDPYFKAEYERLQTRLQHPLTKMEALGALMNKALHVIWAVLRDRTFYDPQYRQAGAGAL